MFIIKCVLLFILQVITVRCHIVGDKNQIMELNKLCDLAHSCFHDTVIACGKSVNEARTFLDLCDLYEYSCETHMVFRHVKEDEICPNQRDLRPGYG